MFLKWEISKIGSAKRGSMARTGPLLTDTQMAEDRALPPGSPGSRAGSFLGVSGSRLRRTDRALALSLTVMLPSAHPMTSAS